MNKSPGKILIYTGDGKGKTTAALGLSVRAVGNGKKVYFAQFIKGPWPSGEDKAVKTIPRITLKKFGLGFVGIMGDKLPLSDHKTAAKKALAETAKIITAGKHDIVVLDEINVACSLKLLEPREVLKVIAKKPSFVTIVLTGRDAPKSFIKKADLVSDVKSVKHYFDDKEMGKQGLEF
ncbi:MAG: cob(I)yrinic acid a,c-diamide adenosyltransferase [bacterium]